MFEQKQRVANSVFFYQMNERLLKIKPCGVVHAAKIQDIDNAKLHVSIVDVS